MNKSGIKQIRWAVREKLELPDGRFFSGTFAVLFIDEVIHFIAFSEYDLEHQMNNWLSCRILSEKDIERVMQEFPLKKFHRCDFARDFPSEATSMCRAWWLRHFANHTKQELAETTAKDFSEMFVRILEAIFPAKKGFTGEVTVSPDGHARR
jgi:hypothetical protein